jgi:hypothetical protein
MQRTAIARVATAKQFDWKPVSATLPAQQASYLDEVVGMLGDELTEGEFDLVLECERRRLPTIFSLGQIRKARGLPAV